MRVDPDILPVFLEEAAGYLRVLRDQSASLEEQLRAAHGLKGAASILGLDPLISCTLMVESELRERHGIPAEALAEAEGWLDRLRASNTEMARPLEADWDPATARMLRKLFTEEANDHLDAMGTALLQFKHQPSSEAVEAMLRKAHTLKGSASTVGLQPVSEAAHRLEEELLPLRAGEQPAPVVLDRLLAAVEAIRTMVNGGDDVCSELTSLVAPDDAPVLVGVETASTQITERRTRGSRRADDQRVRVDVARLDRLMDIVGELVINRTRIERRVDGLNGLARDLGLSRQALRSALGDLRSQSNEPSVARLRDIEDAIAEAATTLDRATADLREDSEGLRRTSRGLQEVVGQVRMMPIHWLHTRLQRPLRGMARSQGKNVELIMADESSEMDRSIAEQVTDSLLQLIRNAVAHGIERPEQRVAAGKPPVGRIRIIARHQADYVHLEVEDDGAGIDPARVREALRQRGPWPGKPIDELSDLEVLDHIFDSGISTRHAADDLAGRGVGLDLVRHNIRALGGTISVSSEPGRGARFSMRIPMTMAIAQALLFRIGDPVYAVPVTHVVETIVLRPGALRTTDGNLEVRARGTWLPLLELHRVLGLEAPLRRSPETTTRMTHPTVVILQFGGAYFGVTCTRIIGPREIVLKRLGRLLSALPLFAGATISGSSKVQFVFDVAFLAQLALGTGPRQPFRSAERESRSAPRVLLADDSRAIREAVAQILRNAGYSVDLAADGGEAWEQLQLRSYDLLLTDLEMPRLHGYELIAKCREAAGLANLPIIVLTSRSAGRNRETALSKGASDFIAKPVNRRVVLEHVFSLLRHC